MITSHLPNLWSTQILDELSEADRKILVVVCLRPRVELSYRPNPPIHRSKQCYVEWATEKKRDDAFETPAPLFLRGGWLHCRIHSEIKIDWQAKECCSETGNHDLDRRHFPDAHHIGPLCKRPSSSAHATRQLCPGTAAKSSFVYGACGSLNIFDVAPISTTSPNRITAILSQT